MLLPREGYSGIATYYFVMFNFCFCSFYHIIMLSTAVKNGIIYSMSYFFQFLLYVYFNFFTFKGLTEEISRQVKLVLMDGQRTTPSGTDDRKNIMLSPPVFFCWRSRETYFEQM